MKCYEYYVLLVQYSKIFFQMNFSTYLVGVELIANYDILDSLIEKNLFTKIVMINIHNIIYQIIQKEKNYHLMIVVLIAVGKISIK